VRRRGGWGRGLREAIAKGWAKYKFTMTDKQAFRDKLVLPTASINVFLTSLTHVGLANVGSLMLLSGHLPLKTGARWPVPGDGGDWGGGARLDGVSGWRVVGRRVAFKENIIRRPELTEGIEDEVIEYLKYLVGGGQPFHFSAAEGGEAAGGTYRITKTIKTRTKSRSKSRGPMGLGKDNRTGRMYVVRKKSMSKPSTETIEFVEREYGARPEGERFYESRLALPAPPTPGSVDSHDDRQPRYVERRPKGTASDGSDDSGPDSGGDRPRIRRASSAGRRGRSRSGTAERQRDTTEAPRTERPSARTYSGQELKDRSQQIRQRIAEERARAIEEIEQKGKASRVRARKSRSRDETLTAEEREQQARREEILETMEFLENEYGVTVTPLEVEREPIDNGRVKTVEPPSAASEFEPKELSDSDESDTPILPGMSRTDRLRAETSLPEYTTSTRDRSYMPRSRFEPSRYEPYSTHNRGRFRRSRPSYHDQNKYSPPPPSADSFDDRYRTRMYHVPPTPLTPSTFGDGHGSRRYRERPRYHHDHHDDEYFGPETSTRIEEDTYLIRKENEKEDRKRSPTRQIIITQDDSSGGLWRRASYGGPDMHRERDLRKREMRRYETDHGQHDTYMSGGIGPHGSDDDPEDSIEIVRR
jgi:hypothetical protein